MRTRTIVAVALLALACHSRSGIRGDAVGSAWLERVYLTYRVPTVYLLFVADVGPPGAPGGWMGSGSVGGWNAELAKRYRDDASLTEINAQPITIRFATLRAGGTSFDLTDGNVLVAHMSSTGALTITQLPGRVGPDEPVHAVVSLIKRSLPYDARVQALPLP